MRILIQLKYYISLTCHGPKVWIILFGVCFDLYILLSLNSNSLHNIYWPLLHKWWSKSEVRLWGHIPRQQLSKILATHALEKNIFFRFILLHTCGTKGNKMEWPLIVCDDKEIKKYYGSFWSVRLIWSMKILEYKLAIHSSNLISSYSGPN